MGYFDCFGKCVVEGYEFVVVVVGFGQVEQVVFGIVDLLVWWYVDWGVKGDVDYVFVDLDQIVVDGKVVNCVFIVFGIDD